ESSSSAVPVELAMEPVTTGTNQRCVCSSVVAGGSRSTTIMSAVAVRAMFRSHPEKPAHTDAISRCLDACFNCVETCTACADACMSERDVAHLVACIRLNLDCAAVCNATGNVMARSNKAGHR